MLYLLRITIYAVSLCLGGHIYAKLDEHQVRVDIVLSPESTPLQQNINVRQGKNGCQYLEIRLTNVSERELSVRSLRVQFPWLTREDGEVLLAAGGTEMGDTKPRIGVPGVRDLESGTYLMAKSHGRYSLAAFVTWNTFWSKLTFDGGDILVTADGENRTVKPGETLSLETIWLAENADWQDLLYTYADEIVRETGAKPRKPKDYVGWATWDYFGRNFSFKDVENNVDELLKVYPQANLLQIDGGWWPYRGDYMLIRDSLPADATKTFANMAKARGLVAGLHFDGTRGDLNSKVAKENPEFFLKDQHGVLLSIPQVNDGDRLNHTYFDYSNPAACDYMRKVASNIRHVWGYDYIKIDFLRFGINEKILEAVRHDGVARDVVPFDRNLTSVERIRRGMQAFRDGMGPDAYFLGCSPVFGLTYGFVDGMRTGDDIHPEYPHFARVCIENSGNFYLHGKVVYNDADYNVVRGQDDQDSRLVKNAQKNSVLTLNEAAMWTHYIALFGGPKINSDHLPILREERRALFHLAASLPTCDRYVPIDFWQHGRNEKDAPSVMLGEAKGVVYLALFNWGDAPKDIRLTGLTAAQRKALVKVDGAGAPVTRDGHLVISLAARHSGIFRLEGSPQFDLLRKAIVAQ